MPGLEITKLYNIPDSIRPYIENHLEPVIENFRKKATVHYRNYYSTQIFIIMVSSLIPIVNVIDIGQNNNTLRLTSAILGGLIVIGTGRLQLNKSYENYILFRTTTIYIQREYQFFINDINEYNGRTVEEKNKMFISIFQILRQLYQIQLPNTTRIIKATMQIKN
jgi:hypothetical protein